MSVPPAGEGVGPVTPLVRETGGGNVAPMGPRWYDAGGGCWAKGRGVLDQFTQPSMAALV
jgi:hypothetical protein